MTILDSTTSSQRCMNHCHSFSRRSSSGVALTSADTMRPYLTHVSTAPPERFSPCRNGFALALNPRADSMVQDYLDTTQQRNDQVVQLLEILIKDWLRTRQLSFGPSVTSPTVKSRKWLSSRNDAALSTKHMALTFFLTPCQ